MLAQRTRGGAPAALLSARGNSWSKLLARFATGTGGLWNRALLHGGSGPFPGALWVEYFGHDHPALDFAACSSHAEHGQACGAKPGRNSHYGIGWEHDSDHASAHAGRPAQKQRVALA